MRKVLIGMLVLAAVGGAYLLGTMSNSAPPAVAAPQPAPTPAIVDNLIVPTGLTMPDKLPTMKIDEPAKVLAGEVKAPVDLLRKEPPANPNFVVPDLSK
jgi:hypothetical protein